MTECTCTFVPLKHLGVVLPGFVGNKYCIYYDEYEDESVIDPKCPYHGDNGTMVVTFRVSSVG